MSDAEVLAALDSRQTLALTADAEARRIPRDRSPVEELIAVMCIARNRRPQYTRWRAVDDSYKAICLAPSQFSCWNAGTDPNHLRLMALARLLVDTNSVLQTIDPSGAVDTELRECLFLADGVIANTIIDRTGGCDSYFAPAAMKPAGRIPAGAIGKVLLDVGDQKFYNAA